MITVGELIEQLQELDPSLEVWQSADEEGNSYSSTSGVDVGQRNPEEGTWRIESVYLEELTEELESQGYTEEDMCENGVTIAVIFP